MTLTVKLPTTLAFFILTTLVCIFFIWYARRRLPVLRSFPALDGIPEMLGRCVEMGRPVLQTPGAYMAELNRPGPIVAAIPIMHYVARQAAKYGVRLITSVGYADTYAAAVPAIESAYRAEGKIELYKIEDIIYWGSLEGYLTGNPSTIASENVGALIQIGNPAAAGYTQNELANRIGAMTACLAPNLGDSIVFYSLCADYLLIGEEYYAASASISGDRTQLGSIVGTDMFKIAVLGLIVIGVVLTAAAPALAKQFIDAFKL